MIDEFENLTVEQALRRILKCLTPLKASEIKSHIATGHHVVLIDADEFRNAKNFLDQMADQLKNLENEN